MVFVSSSDFRQIAIKGEAGKAERLFRASVSAFCSLTRPSRREIAQLDDLTLPLFDMVSVESRRYVAAALSECEYAPAGLIRRLCDETVDIAAPLLIRSRALTDVDLIALIGRHGISHARAIARRPGLNPAIAGLARALDRPVLVQTRREADAKPQASLATAPDRTFQPARSADDARRRLRSMMEPAQQAPNAPMGAASYTKLRDTALTGNAVFFQTALADAMGIGFAEAGGITSNSGYSALLAALRALDLSEERAFLVVAAACPAQFSHPEAIRLFLERFRSLDHETALERVRGWKAETIATSVAASPPAFADAARLRAS